MQRLRSRGSRSPAKPTGFHGVEWLPLDLRQVIRRARSDDKEACMYLRSTGAAICGTQSQVTENTMSAMLKDTSSIDLKTNTVPEPGTSWPDRYRPDDLRGMAL